MSVTFSGSSIEGHGNSCRLEKKVSYSRETNFMGTVDNYSEVKNSKGQYFRREQGTENGQDRKYVTNNEPGRKV